MARLELEELIFPAGGVPVTKSMEGAAGMLMRGELALLQSPEFRREQEARERSKMVDTIGASLGIMKKAEPVTTFREVSAIRPQ